MYIWFSSSTVLDVGKRICLSGTIKAHTERNGVKQNLLTRCNEIVLKNYFALLPTGEMHRFDNVLDEKEVKQLLKDKLGVKRLPNGVNIFNVGE